MFTEMNCHILCVYTYDHTDEDDVFRVRNQLRGLGFRDKLIYKTDEATRAGIYAKNGYKKVWKYKS